MNGCWVLWVAVVVNTARLVCMRDVGAYPAIVHGWSDGQLFGQGKS